MYIKLFNVHWTQKAVVDLDVAMMRSMRVQLIDTQLSKNSSGIFENHVIVKFEKYRLRNCQASLDCGVPCLEHIKCYQRL